MRMTMRKRRRKPLSGMSERHVTRLRAAGRNWRKTPYGSER
jgi:hypothetical protein